MDSSIFVTSPSSSPEQTSSLHSATPEFLATKRIIAVANQKGGVGKTTTAINLATAMSAAGKKTLVIDFDPQANATTGFGLSGKESRIGSYDLLVGEHELDAIVVETLVPNLFIVPSSTDLIGAEVALRSMADRYYQLSRKLKTSRHAWDLILIDCPPSLGRLTINALVAANAVLVPLQCEFFALQGLARLTRTVEEVRRRYNTELEIAGVLLTMFDRRNNLSQQVEADVRKHMGNTVYDTVIPRNVRVSEAPSHGKPVMLYDHRSAGSVAYAHLAGEMIRKAEQQAARIVQ